MTDLTQDQLDALTAWDTPTICNALEIVAPERRLTGFTIKPFAVLYPEMKPIVGVARPATIRAMDRVDGGSDRRSDYYGYVAADGLKTIAVVQDLDFSPGFGALWGEVNTTVHKGLGVGGCVTNGSFRDVDACAEDFQILGGMVGPSHAWVDIMDFGHQVNVHGMDVRHDDVIHADRHGAVVVPRDVVAKIPDAVGLLERREAVILDAARSPGFNIDVLREALSGAREIH